MADLAEVKGKIKIDADTKGADDASRALGGFGSSLQNVVTIAAGVALERVAEKIIEIGKASAQFAVETSSKFEQWNISFTTMLGSADKAAQLMNQISDFAVKTPFELPQLVEGSKRLLAYNFEAKQVVPTMQMLGDIASGVGTDKLPNLILAFGQVNAATKLTGMELRQFSEAGVPLLQALVDQANKAGGAWVTVGGAAKKSKVDVGEMNDKLAIASQRLKEAEGNAKTKQSTLMSLRNTIQNYNEKITGAAGSTEAARKVWVKTTVTAQDMIEKISKGEISFNQVQKALEGMTQKGGRFFNNMEAQSKTFGGTISNVRDQFSRFALAIMGFDMASGSKTFGQLQQGTLFDKLKGGAQALLDFLNSNQGAIVTGFRGIAASFDAILIVSTKLWGHIKTAFTPTLNTLNDVYTRHKSQIDTIAHATGVVLYGAFVGLIYIIAGAIEGFARHADILLTIFGPALEYVGNMINALGNNWNSIVNSMRATFMNFVNGVIDAINVLIKGINKIPGMSISTIDHVSLSSTATGAISKNTMAGGSPVNIYNNNNFNTSGSGTQLLNSLNFQLANVRG